MGRRRVFLGQGGGGIDAGAPFALGGVLVVEQVSPPVAQTIRLALLEPGDTWQSIIAPGSQGAAHSFVLGEDAEDSPNGPRSVLLGYQLRQNTGGGAGQAADQVLVGNSIQLPSASRNSQGFVGVGSAQVFTAFLGVADSFGQSVVIGNTAGLVCINAGGGDATNAVAIGSGTRAHGGSVVIGASASDSNTTAVVIGQNGLGGLQSVAVGLAADATAARSISIGNRARAGTADTIAIGWFADAANSDSSIVIGKQASSMAKFANIMIGRNAAVAADNFCQIGGDLTYFISELRFGAGNSQATGGNTYTFSITDVFTGAGNNLQGNGLVIKSGSGTGNWANTQNRGIDLQCGLVQGTGSTQQPPTSVLALRHSDLNVALWGGLGAPFSGGAGVLFIKNAATNPAVAAVAGGGILSVQGGNLHFLNAAGVDTALTPGASGGVSVQQAVVTLTNAQMLALPTTPVALIAAPGAGNAIIVLSCTFTSINAVAITGFLGGETLNLPYAANAARAVTNVANSPFQALCTSSSFAFTVPIADSRLIAQITNAAVNLTSVGGAGTNFLGGSAGNSLKVTLTYIVITV